MKTFLKLICITLFYTSTLMAGEFTGAGAVVESVLQKNNLSIAKLQNEGFKVLLGEVTGAGKSVPLDALEYVVTKKELMRMNDVTHINFKNPSAAKALGDIRGLEFNGKRVSIGKIQGVVFK